VRKRLRQTLGNWGFTSASLVELTAPISPPFIAGGEGGSLLPHQLHLCSRPLGNRSSAVRVSLAVER